MSVPDPPRLEHYQVHGTRNGATISFRAGDDAGLAAFRGAFPRAWYQRGYQQWFVINDGTGDELAEWQVLAWRKAYVVAGGGSGTFGA